MSYFEIPALTLIEYSRAGKGKDFDLAVDIIRSVKYGRTSMIIPIIEEFIETGDIHLSLFEGNTLLVPMPGSKPLLKDSTHPTLELCKVLYNHGLGVDIENLLYRKTAIRKAAFQQGADNRPSIQEHYESIEGHQQKTIQKPNRIILVDDVLTQGRTACACYRRVQEIYSDIPIVFFGIARTVFKFENLYLPNESIIKNYPSGKSFVDHDSNWTIE